MSGLGKHTDDLNNMIRIGNNGSAVLFKKDESGSDTIGSSLMNKLFDGQTLSDLT